MVKYYDDQAVYNAPVSEVWALIEAHSDENIPKMHPSFRSAHTTQESEGVMERDIEIEDAPGHTEHMHLRFTAKPPTSLTIDYLDGPMAGSWVCNTYVPEGGKTRVVCAGDFHVDGMDDEEALEMVGDMLDSRFEEDARYLNDMMEHEVGPQTV